MNPSSLDIDLSAVQSHKDMNRNRLGDELGETNKLYGIELFIDEDSPACPDLSGSTFENIFSARQQVTCS